MSGPKSNIIFFGILLACLAKNNVQGEFVRHLILAAFGIVLSISAFASEEILCVQVDNVEMDLNLRVNDDHVIESAQLIDHEMTESLGTGVFQKLQLDQRNSTDYMQTYRVIGMPFPSVGIDRWYPMYVDKSSLYGHRGRAILAIKQMGSELGLVTFTCKR